MNSSFSVLMSLYSKENPIYFRQALESVYSQTLLPDEVVLIEDGPLTPSLSEVADEFSRKYPTLKRYRLQTNGGLGNALNYGLNKCSHDLVARMDTDDTMPETRFERQVRFMDEHPEVSVCSGWVVEVMDEDGQRLDGQTKKLPERHEDIYKYGKSRSPVNHPACIYRKQDVVSSGGYGPYPEDYYLWARMMVKGYRFHTIQETLYYMRFNSKLMHRRGGWRYLCREYACQREMLRLGYINKARFVFNMAIRAVVRLVPNVLRKLIYMKFLR